MTPRLLEEKLRKGGNFGDGRRDGRRKKQVSFGGCRKLGVTGGGGGRGGGGGGRGHEKAGVKVAERGARTSGTVYTTHNYVNAQTRHGLHA